MKDLSIYFAPIDFNEQSYPLDSIGRSISVHTEQHFPSLDQKGVAVMYVPEFRAASRKELDQTGVSFRKAFYQLFVGQNWDVSIYDLGSILPGAEKKDTEYALSQVIEQLIKKDIVPIVIGGSQDLTLAMYNAYKSLEQLVNLATIDAKLDMGDMERAHSEEGWLSHILLDKTCYLFNYSNLGAQTHYIAKGEIELFDKLYFDVTRLGLLSADIKLAEPIMRNSDIVSFDLRSIRKSDLSGDAYISPNGFFGHEACQLARYAGISDKLTAIGFLNYYASGTDISGSALVGQLIWYFVDGYANRKGDFPIGSKKNYKKFRVSFDDFKEEIVFYKSEKSARWWMEVPYPDSKGRKYQRHHMVPCSYIEYQEAMKGEMPNLWWKTYQKLV